MSGGPPVLVVGAGFAGLAAAVRLHDAGVPVRLVDAGPPGGKARTEEPLPGWRIETGPHSFTHRAEPFFRLVERLGLADRLVRAGPAARARHLVRAGRLRRASLTGGGVGLGEWAAVVRGLFRVSPPDGTVGDWMRATFGAGLADGAGGAATIGIWGCAPDEVELAAGFPALAEALRTHGSLWRVLRRRGVAPRHAGTYGLPGGLGEIVDAAVRHVGGVERARVRGLVAGPGGWRVEGLGVFPAVILAVEAPAAAELVPAVAGPLREVRYSPLLALHWKAPDAALPVGFGYLAPPAEGRPVLGTLGTSDVFPARCPAGERAFCTMIGGTAHPELVDLDEQAARRLLEEEHHALTGRSVHLTGLVVVRHPRAVAIPGPGHAARLARVAAGLPPHLHLAGAWMGAGAVPDAIRAGELAADQLIAGSAADARVA